MERIKYILKSNIIVKNFFLLKNVLPITLKKNALYSLLLLVLSSIIDFFGLALLLPLFFIVLDENAITNIEILNYIFNFLGFEDTKYFSIFLSLSVGVVFLIKNVFLILIAHYQIKFSFELYKYFSIKSLNYYFSKGYMYIKSYDANYLVRNISFIPKIFSRQFVIPFLNVLNDLLVIFIILVVLVLQEPVFVLILILVLLPFFLMFYFLIKKRIQNLELFDLNIQPKISRTLFQFSSGYLDLLVNKAFSKIDRRNVDYVSASTENGVKLLTLKALPQKVIESAMVMSLVAIVCFGLFYFDTNAELMNALAFFAIAAFRIMPSINRILISLVNLKGYEYVFEFLNPVAKFEESSIVTPKRTESNSVFKNKIKFDSISFAYDDKDVFSDFTFEFNVKDTIGIIGPSGSGKSTLMLLLLGVLFPKKGSILIDDVKLTENNVSDWHDLVSIVPQDIFIIDGSLKENITLSLNENKINEEALERALKLSSLTQFVATLDKGIETEIKDKGNNLSGGQKQRISIARAVYNGAKVIVFDEATSALDVETEKEINNSILTLQKEGYTIVIVAHRYTTLAHCDKIIEVNNSEFTIVEKSELKRRMPDL